MAQRVDGRSQAAVLVVDITLRHPQRVGDGDQIPSFVVRASPHRPVRINDFDGQAELVIDGGDPRPVRTVDRGDVTLLVVRVGGCVAQRIDTSQQPVLAVPFQARGGAQRADLGHHLPKRVEIIGGGRAT
jgi:hypothetical protein